MLNHYRIIRFSVPLLITVLFTWSCTDLEETPFDLVTPGNFYKTEAELTAAVVRNIPFSSIILLTMP